MSHWPALLQTGDQGGMWPVHRRNVCQRAVWTDRGETTAEDQLGRKHGWTVWHLVKLLSTWRQQITACLWRAVLCFINICRPMNRHEGSVGFCKTWCKESCAAKPECKNGHRPVKAILQKCLLFLLLFFLKSLHLFISYLFLYIDCSCIVPWLSSGVHRLFFVPMQALLHYREIFLYQKVFHTFMCSIECTKCTVSYYWNW